MRSELASIALEPGFPAAGFLDAERLPIEAHLQEFVQSLSHELRAPVAAIAGFGKALEASLDPDASERIRHYVARIRAAGEQLGGYLEALGSLTRATPDSVRVAEVDFSAMARSVLDDLQLLEPQRCVSWQVQDGLRAYGDPPLLRMVLQNLLGNAWKFTSRTPQGRIEFAASAASGWHTTYRVRDNGVGFDSAYAPKLFKEFQRLHSHAEFPGTGLGLSNVRRIVTRHGGQVWAESEGRGATFFFTLPGPCVPAHPGHRRATRSNPRVRSDRAAARSA